MSMIPTFAREGTFRISSGSYYNSLFLFFSNATARNRSYDIVHTNK